MSQNLRRFPIQYALIALVLCGGVWALGPAMQAAQKDETVVAQTVAVAQSTEPVSFRLKFVSATEARRMLHELLGSNADSARIVADTQKSRLLVEGDADTILLAKRLLSELDRPPQDVEKSADVVQTYQCVNKSTKNIADAIRSKFGTNVNVSSSDSRLLIVAKPDVQRIVAAFLEQLDQPGSRQFNSSRTRSITERPLIPQIIRTPPRTEVDRTPLTLDITFRTRSATTLQGALQRLFVDRLRLLSDQSFIFETEDGLTVNLQFANDAVCRLHGPTFLVNQFAKLLQQLDSQSDAQKTRFIRIQKADRHALNKALNRVRSDRAGQPQMQQGPQSQRSTGSSDVQLTAFQQNAAAANQAETDPAAPPLRRPGSDVRIEALPDLDVIILQGRDADVDELTRIIQEIERISEETTPQIEVYHLQNARGAAVDELIESVLDDLIGPLQGRVSITPLQKPNALLLIGWGEAVKAVQELIAKLDSPVPAPTQIKVFALKNSSATEIRETITEFFDDRGGLGPEAVISADIRTNSVIVNAAPRDLAEVELLIEQLDSGTTKSVNQAKMLKLKNSLAADIASTVEAAIDAARGGDGSGRSAALEMLLSGPDGDQVLKSGLLGDVRLVPDPRTNTLFLSGPAESIRLVEELINTLDATPVSAAQLKVFQVQHGSAGELVEVLRTLFPTQGSGAPQLAAAADEASLAPVRFSVDARTNTIIATGSAGDMRIVEALLIRLDQDGSQQRTNRVYRLRNSPALDVAQAVNEFLRSERIVQLAGPGSDNPFQQIETEVVVVPEPVGNSLLISATPRFYDEIIQLIEDLDEQPAQVQIQVILAEVELGDIHEFGIEMGIQDSLLFDRSLLGDLVTTTQTNSGSTPSGIITSTNEIIQAASNSPGFNFNNFPLGNSGSDQSLATAALTAGQALSHFAVGRVNNELGYGGLVLSASSENLSVLLRALNQSRRVDVLSRPHVMTLDNQPAFIQVGQRVPRITGTTINEIGQVNNVELEDVGLILGVTPRISQDGMVVMEIDAEKSEVGPESDGIPVSISDGAVVRSPRVNIAVAQTTVSAASGQTVIIGGLITDKTESITRRVPWLSDVPFLGELFKYDGMKNRRTELLIILTPHVIRNRADAEHVKQLEMSRMSWCSQDIFEWLAPEDGLTGAAIIDDSCVPVIYPDDAPGAPDLQPVDPEFPSVLPNQVPETDSDVVWPLEPMSRTNSSIEQSGIRQAGFVKDAPEPARQKRSRWPFRRRTKEQ